MTNPEKLSELGRRLGAHGVEDLLEAPPEVLAWFVSQVLRVNFRGVRRWAIHHHRNGTPFRIDKIEEGAVKLVDIQGGRKSA